MERRKLESAALFLTIFGVVLIMPPFTLLFDAPVRVLNVPVKMLYLFGVWVALIAGAAWLSNRMADSKAVPPRGED